MRTLIVSIACLLCFATVAPAQVTQPTAAAEGGEWKPLFNGKDLTGWYTYLQKLGKDNDPDKIFQVHDGMIHIYKDAVAPTSQPFGYIATKEEFADCRIRLEYKWGEKRFGRRATARRDSGLLYFFVGEDGPGGKTWPQSVECQIQENDTGDTYAIMTGCSSTIDPATKDAKQPTFKDASDGGVPFTTANSGNDRIIHSEKLEKDGWNTVELVLQGDSATHIVNGKMNMKISKVFRKDPNDPNKTEPIKRGKILLQAEGAEVMYRNVEVRELK